MGCRGSALAPSSATFLGTLVGSWIRSETTRTETDTRVGCRWWLNSLHYNAGHIEYFSFYVWCVSLILMSSRNVRVVPNGRVILVSIFLMTSDVPHLFIWLLTIFLSFLDNIRVFIWETEEREWARPLFLDRGWSWDPEIWPSSSTRVGAPQLPELWLLPPWSTLAESWSQEPELEIK